MLPPNSRPHLKARQERSRVLRREMSVSEKRLWSLIRNRKLGPKFRRQYSVGSYTLDFYCPEHNLCIEVDGEQHFGSLDDDMVRDAELAVRGIRVIRIPSLDLFEENGRAIGSWLRVISEACGVEFRQ